MPTDSTPAPRRELRIVPEGDELDDLLRSVERIQAGLGDMRELVIKATVSPTARAPRRAWPVDVEAMKVAREAYVHACIHNHGTVTLSRAAVLGLLFAAGQLDEQP